MSDASTPTDPNAAQSNAVKSNAVKSTEALRTTYRQPSERVQNKIIHHVDEGAAEFLARAPFLVMATTDGNRVDASPRGGTPGFVRVISPNQVAFGDLTGNNLLDSLTNLVQHPAIGLVVMIPGLEETLRINGTATVSTDDDLREACAIDGRIPRTVTLIEVEHLYLQCGAALRRSGAWQPETWPAKSERPTGGQILAKHMNLDVAPEVIDNDLANYYDNFIWEVGGVDPDA